MFTPIHVYETVFLWQSTLWSGSSMYICACAHRVCGSYDVVGEYIVSGRDLISLSQSSVDSHEIEIPEGTHWVVDFPAGFLWESKYVFSTSYSYSLLHLNSSANRNQYCSIKVGYRCAILSSFYHDLTHFTTLFN